MFLCRQYSVLIVLPALLLAKAGHADDLMAVYRLALQQDPVIGEARARYEAEHTLLVQGRAGLLPSVTLYGTTARNVRAPEAEFSYAAGFNSHSYGVNIRQSLLNLEAWYRWQSARDSDRGALATLTEAEQGLMLRVATAYFNNLRSVENLAAFAAEEAAAAGLLDQATRRFEVGLAAITDVNEAQAGFDLARVNRLREERNLNQSRLLLEAITGGDHAVLESLRDDFPITAADPASADAWVALAEQNSPALQIAQYQLAASRNTAKAARAAHFPTLTLDAGYDDIAESANVFSFFPNTASNSAGVSLNLNIPIFTGGLNSARKRQAYHLRDASEQALLGTARETERMTRDSYLGIEIDVQAIAAWEQAITSAESALQAVETGAGIGTRNVVDVVLAQRTLYQAQRDHANARYDYVIDTLTLKQAAGVLTPQDIIELNAWLE